MDFFELVEISTHAMEQTNPTSVEKLQMVGRYLQLEEGQRVVDFGCGYGRALALWAEDFKIEGLGIEIHTYLCQQAQARIAQAGLKERVRIICQNPLTYAVEPAAFDVAVCLGATFIWGGFHQALRQIKKALKPGGRMILGEPYYNQEVVPEELIKYEGDIHPEFELLQISREEGFEVEWGARASQDDWDRYVSGSWGSLLRWIEENPDHPEHAYVRDYLHRHQDIYFRYQRQYEGWGIYLLKSKLLSDF